MSRAATSSADADEGRGDGLTSAEKKELVELRRKAKQLELENDNHRVPSCPRARRIAILGGPGVGDIGDSRWPNAA